MDSPTPHVPYQAYKSKRHSRTVSNPYFEPNVSPPPQSRKPSYASSQGPVSPESENVRKPIDGQDVPATVPLEPKELNGFRLKARPVSMLGALPRHESTQDHPIYEQPEPPTESTPLPAPVASSSTQASAETPTISINGSSPLAEAGPSVKPSVVQRKSSTFRYVPLRTPSTSTPRNSSPLRPVTAHTRTLSTASTASNTSTKSAPTRQFDQLQLQPQRPVELRNQHSSFGAARAPQSPLANGVSPQPPPSINQLTTPMQRNGLMILPTSDPFVPPHRSSSLAQPPRPPPQSSSPLSSQDPSPLPSPGPSAPSTPGATSPPIATTPTASTSSARTLSTGASTTPSTPTPTSFKAAYRPGFQPKGVYRPRTDEFITLRTQTRAVGRVERTRLERRFEKLIELHFPPAAQVQSVDEKGKAKEIGSKPPHPPNRRASSFFEDLNDLRTKGAGELWRGVMESRAAALRGTKGDVRASEQKITPWQDDADVSACPLCTTAFHPITNRKHHCRLCGQIICSLPPKAPQRPVACSLLFVADAKTGHIEEVSEGVDYGVRPRSSAGSPGKSGKGKGEGLAAEEKFLKGVRICRECKPVMLRQQYRQEAKRIPTFARLYEALKSLEAEIEEALPQFQELMLSLSANPDDAPPKEATAARKRLLDSFAEYDALAKRIRKLPCPGGTGSSQDRVQHAILSRANLFLQKNMFPLQSLPKPKQRTASTTAQANGVINGVGDAVPAIDPDSELAHALQPLLEQEALLESFIEEAKAHRKFEDAKTLKANLSEIKLEIDRIMANGEGVGDEFRGAGKTKAGRAG